MMWESSRQSSYGATPQEVVVRLGSRSSITSIQLQAKPNRFCNGVTIFIGSATSLGNFLEFEKAGESDRVTSENYSQIGVTGVGTHLKLRFNVPARTSLNPCGAVGIRLMKVFGTPTGYHDGRHASEKLVLVSGKDTVDSVRLELGVPLRHLNEKGDKSLAYAQVDDETR